MSSILLSRSARIANCTAVTILGVLGQLMPVTASDMDDHGGFADYVKREFDGTISIGDGGHENVTATLSGEKEESFLSYGRGSIPVQAGQWLVVTYSFLMVSGTPALKLVLAGEGRTLPGASFGRALTRGTTLEGKCAAPAFCTRTVRYFVESGTETVFVGYTLAGQGEAQVHAVEVAVGPPHASSSPSREVRSYLQGALKRVERSALFASRLDWRRTHKLALMHLDGSSTIRDAQAVIARVLMALGDRHSHLRTDEQYFGGTGSAAVPFELRVGEDNIARLILRGGAEGLKTTVVDAERRNPRGWIIDLSEMSGGDFPGVMAALCKLVGATHPGSFVNRDGDVFYWTCQTGGFAVEARRRAIVKKDRTAEVSGGVSGIVPVAVLTSKKTASAGENIAIAFIGRDNYRSFGEATAGLTSSNEVIPLNDGSLLAIASGWPTDRLGNEHKTEIVPVVREPDPKFAEAAAEKWLNTQVGLKVQSE